MTDTQTPGRVLPDLAQQMAAMRAEIEALRAQNEELKAKRPATLVLKLTQRKLDANGEMTGVDGAISLYGVRRFPLTYYAAEWEKILGHADAIRAFIAANKAKLAFKA